MDRQMLNILNAAIFVVILAVALSFWFYMRDQFVWGLLLILLLLVIAVLVNAVGRGLSAEGAMLALSAFLILGFAWFYMQPQFMWAIIVVLLLALWYEWAKLARWLKDTVSIQIIIERKGDGRGPGEPGEPRKPADKK